MAGISDCGGLSTRRTQQVAAAWAAAESCAVRRRQSRTGESEGEDLHLGRRTKLARRARSSAMTKGCHQGASFRVQETVLTLPCRRMSRKSVDRREVYTA